ncbi:quinolinate synthase NadA [Candidatus Pacearchaeota archaeon]|nr:quinolinate synthase NadA [Candidatus Pacearchaeota archaeon]
MKSIRDEIQDILQLKKERNAVIMGHYYQSPEIYEVADYIGDSLELAQRSSNTGHQVIVLAGVHFMAEIAKILNPEKTVLLPNLDASCEMVDMITAADVKELKAKHPGVPVVTYVNSSAAVKAESDVCCTSRNALDIVASLNSEEVIFVPDKNIGNYVQLKTNKDIQMFNGYCYVHKEITNQVIDVKRQKHPGAVVLAHPECELDVLEKADVVASTGGMLNYLAESDENEFIVGTEEGFINELRKQFPEKIFYSLNQICRGMKAITLADIKQALEKNIFEITVPEETSRRAKKAIDRMLE